MRKHFFGKKMPKSHEEMVFDKAKRNRQNYAQIESGFKTACDALKGQLESVLKSYAVTDASGHTIYQQPVDEQHLFSWKRLKLVHEVSAILSDEQMSTHEKISKCLLFFQRIKHQMNLTQYQDKWLINAVQDRSLFFGDAFFYRAWMGEILVDQIQAINQLQKDYNKNEQEMFDLADAGNADDAVKYFPTNEALLLKCYAANPSCLDEANPVIVQKLVVSGQIKMKDVLDAFAENEFFIKMAFQQAQQKMLNATNGEISALEKEELGVALIPEEHIVNLIKQGDLNLELVLKLFPKNQYIAMMCYQQDPLALRFADPAIVAALAWLKQVDVQHAMMAFPQCEEVILACYNSDKGCIAQADEKIISHLVVDHQISIQDALDAFPENEFFIKMALQKAFLSRIDSAKSIIRLITRHQLNAEDAVMQFPKNRDIVLFVYQHTPALLKLADFDLINQLGEEQAIKEEDVLKIFGLHRLSDEEKKERVAQFQQAVDGKNWTEVQRLSQAFWFEKQTEINLQSVTEELVKNQQWEDLYQLEQTIKKNDEAFVAGPLMKSPETYQLENLMRKLMENGNFSMITQNNSDYFVFSDGVQFNWSRIRTHANLQHIDLNDADFKAYQTFMPDSVAISTLFPAQESQYRDALYASYHAQGEPLPDCPISFSEMQALNIYTGDFYTTMNGLIQNDTSKFDCTQTFNHEKTRSALIHSVMCASALRKVPMTDLKVCYRKESFGSDQKQARRIKAAAQQSMMQLDGFVSTSMYPLSLFSSKRVQYVFQNLSGVNVAPVSHNPQEKEFLIPPTQVQMAHYVNNQGFHCFSASLVSVLDEQPEATFQAEKNLISMARVHTKTLLRLVEKGDLSAKMVVYSFPNDVDVLLACYQKDPLSIQYANVSIVAALVESGRIAPDDARLVFPDEADIVAASATVKVRRSPTAVSSEELLNDSYPHRKWPLIAVKADKRQKILTSNDQNVKTKLNEIKKISNLSVNDPSDFKPK